MALLSLRNPSHFNIKLTIATDRKITLYEIVKDIYHFLSICLWGDCVEDRLMKITRQISKNQDRVSYTLYDLTVRNSVKFEHLSMRKRCSELVKDNKTFFGTQLI